MNGSSGPIDIFSINFKLDKYYNAAVKWPQSQFHLKYSSRYNNQSLKHTDHEFTGKYIDKEFVPKNVGKYS